MIKWTRDALMIGDFSLRYYGMLIALGVLLGVLLAVKREKRLGLAKDTTIDLALVGVPAALVGARLYYVIFSWDMYKDNLWKIFSVREGGILRPGYSEEVDRLRNIRDNGAKCVAELEAREKERTGIKKLKVGYNKVFGYYIDVPNSAGAVELPEEYIRKQTLVNGERYFTPELKKLEDETGMFGSITDEEIKANEGRTYQDATALRDPLIGMGYEPPESAGEETESFEWKAKDSSAEDYKGQPREKNGRFTFGKLNGGSSTRPAVRATLKMSKTELRRVSSGILTDHPDLKAGEKSDYFFDSHYYEFIVKGPGDYHFTQRIRIVGNEDYIDKAKWRG